MSRPETVARLTMALLDTLQKEAADTTATEMFSAALTLVNQIVVIMLRMGADPDALRSALNVVYESIPDESKTVH
jgi:hypothetical protein